MVTEDDIDMESLQAQIDMTMSFAQNLVMSWIKPTHLAQLRSRSANATQTLEEESRRPPRLGVGAPIPAAPPLSHEASKLKRRLGKNRTKHESVMESQDSSKSDDEEHKGRLTKRKTKADPFGHEGSKKKRKDESTTSPYPSVETVCKSSVFLLKDSALGELAKHSSSSQKEMQRTGSGDQQSHVQPSATPISSPPVRSPIQTTFFPSLTASTTPSKPTREFPAPVPGIPTPECSRVHTSSVAIPDKAKPLGIPLLNLDGPPELIDIPGDTSEMNKTKKKRRRRKRKKNQLIAGTGYS